MREILFKAKRLDDGEWVEGYYYSYETLECFGKGKTYHYILKPGFADWSMPRPTEFYEIDINTLCQFTGVTDKNGNKIWENDIIDLSDCWWNGSGPAGYHSPIIPVEWSGYHCGFDPFANYDCDCGVYYEPTKTKAIGNKFDNSELLKE